MTPVKPHSKRHEVNCLAEYISEVFLSRDSTISKTQHLIFREELIALLNRKYDGHWYPANPLRGTGFREISIYFKFVDQVLSDAAAKAQITTAQLQGTMGLDVTFFVDPGCVSYRRGCSYQNTGTVNQIYPVEEAPQSPAASPERKTDLVLVSDSGSETSSLSGEEEECYSSFPGSPDSGFGSQFSPQRYSPQIHDSRIAFTGMHCREFNNQWMDSRVSLAV